MSILNRVRRYGFALFILVLGGTVMNLPIIRDSTGAPGVVLFFLILLAAWYGGLGPGLLITAIIALLISTTPVTSGRAVLITLFLACGGAISVLAEIQRASRRRAEESRSCSLGCTHQHR